MLCLWGSLKENSLFKVTVKVMNYTSIDKTNLSSSLPIVLESLQSAWAIAIDCEFSGLGDGLTGTRDQNLEVRYRALKCLVETHGCVSLGLSIVKRDQSNNITTYSVNNFDFLVICQSPFTCSPSSMKFLRRNGFDFNALIDRGIPFYRGAEPETDSDEFHKENQSIRMVLRGIMQASCERKVPLLVHNGFLDLMFIYNSFYAPLPPVLDTFIADVNEMFSGGIYDTKYVSDYVYHEEVSFLEFLYHKYLRQNSTENKMFNWVIEESFNTEATEQEVQEQVTLPNTSGWCEAYGYHGYCKLAEKCPESHDIQIILDGLMKRQLKRKRDALKLNSVTTIKPGVQSCKEPKESQQQEQLKTAVQHSNQSIHSAYYDACMTAFVFCRYVYDQEKGEAEDELDEELNAEVTEKREWREAWRNRIYIIGKSIPLLLTKSQFAKTSPAHQKARLKQLQP